MTRPEQKAGSKRLREEAARLLVEVRTEPGDVSRRALSEWLTTSPDHVAAYLEVARISDALVAAAEQANWSVDELVSAANAESVAAAAVPLYPKVAQAGGARSRELALPTVPRTRFRWIALAAAVGIVVIGGLVSWVVSMNGDDMRYVTAIGEQRVFTLDDGSTVHLNTRSELVVRFDQHRRRIDLMQGEAYFAVAKDPERPFHVYGGDTVFSALGTRFNVRLWENRAQVTVVEGLVAVLAEPQEPTNLIPANAEARRVPVPSGSGPVVADAKTIQLAAGEQASIVGAAIEQNESANLDQVTAWTSRRLVFDSEPLSSVLEEFNRYSHDTVRVEDPALSTLEISGTFDLGDVESLLDSLQAIRRVEVVRETEDTRIVRPRT